MVLYSVPGKDLTCVRASPVSSSADSKADCQDGTPLWEIMRNLSYIRPEPVLPAGVPRAIPEPLPVPAPELPRLPEFPAEISSPVLP